MAHPKKTPIDHQPTGRLMVRRSRRTGKTYHYGDFRAFRDVGGRVEALREPGARLATNDEVLAFQLLAERAHELQWRLERWRIARGGAGARGAHLGAMVDAHLAAKANPHTGKAPSTIRRDRSALANVVRYFGDIPLATITTPRLEDYVRVRLATPGLRLGTAVAPHTVRNELNALSNLFRRAVSLGLTNANPVAALVDRPNGSQRTPLVLSREEGWRLLQTADAIDAESRQAAGLEPGHRFGWYATILATLLYTGGRLMEVLGLLVSDVDFARRRIVFRANSYRHLKRAHHQREVELWPDLTSRLTEYLIAADRGRGLLFPGRFGGLRRSMKRPLDRCVLRAGLASLGGITPHTLRHTYATMLLQTLVPVAGGGWAMRSSFDAAKRLGHRGTGLVDGLYGHLVESPTYRPELSYRPGDKPSAHP
jgi:integrase